MTPLLASCEAGECAIARLLIEAGADVRVEDAEGRTPLSLALASRSQELEVFIQSVLKVPPIAIDRLTLQQPVGEGNFGVVFLAQFVGSDHAVKMPRHQAVRHLSTEAIAVPKWQQLETYAAFLHEAVISSEIGYKPQVIPFLGGHLTLDRSLLVYNFMDSGSVEDYLEIKRGPTSNVPSAAGEREKTDPRERLKVANILTQAAIGLWSLHEARVLHRDVAARNFLINSVGTVFICDFGLSVKLPIGQAVLRDKAKGPFKNNAPESLHPELEKIYLSTLEEDKQNAYFLEKLDDLYANFNVRRRAYSDAFEESKALEAIRTDTYETGDIGAGSSEYDKPVTDVGASSSSDQDTASPTKTTTPADLPPPNPESFSCSIQLQV
eukprot:g76697.t1